MLKSTDVAAISYGPSAAFRKCPFRHYTADPPNMQAACAQGTPILGMFVLETNYTPDQTGCIFSSSPLHEFAFVSVSC